MARRGEKKYDDATRQAALMIARKESAAEASRQLGISVNTIRGWRREAGESGPPTGANPASWAQKKEEGARQTWEKARSALDLVQTRLNQGDERKAKDAALTMAILIDKSAVLEKASALEEERQARLSQRQGEAIAGALVAIFEDLELPRSEAVKAVFAHHLRSLEEPDASTGGAPTSDRARADLRRSLRAEWEREEEPVSAPLPQLPPPSEREDGEEAEVVDAEVVADSEPSQDLILRGGDPVCPSCGRVIPRDEIRTHLAGLDAERLDCPAQDIQAIRNLQRDSPTFEANW